MQQAFRNVCWLSRRNPSFCHSLIEHLLCTRLQAAFRKDTQTHELHLGKGRVWRAGMCPPRLHPCFLTCLTL